MPKRFYVCFHSIYHVIASSDFASFELVDRLIKMNGLYSIQAAIPPEKDYSNWLFFKEGRPYDPS